MTFSDLSISYQNRTDKRTRVRARFYEGEWVAGDDGWGFDRTLLESRTIDFPAGVDDATIAARLDAELAALTPYPKVGDAPALTRTTWRTQRMASTVVAGMPCPLDEAGRINPQVTRFALADEAMGGRGACEADLLRDAGRAWRPLSGCAAITATATSPSRPDRVSWVHPRFLLWLMKRQRVAGGRNWRFWKPGYSGCAR